MRRSVHQRSPIHGGVRPQKFALKVHRLPQEFIVVASRVLLTKLNLFSSVQNVHDDCVYRETFRPKSEVISSRYPTLSRIVKPVEILL